MRSRHPWLNRLFSPHPQWVYKTGVMLLALLFSLLASLATSLYQVHKEIKHDVDYLDQIVSVAIKYGLEKPTLSEASVASGECSTDTIEQLEKLYVSHLLMSIPIVNLDKQKPYTYCSPFGVEQFEQRNFKNLLNTQLKGEMWRLAIVSLSTAPKHPPYLYGSNGQYGFLFPLRTEYLFLENDLDHQRSIRLSLPKENYTILEIGSLPNADRLYSNSVASNYLPLTFESSVSTSRVLSKFKQNLWPVTTLLFMISLTILWLCVSYWHAKKEIALQKAVRDAQFFPYYQPIVDAQTGKMLGVEALLRWLPSDGRVIEPSKFIHYLEQSGEIIPTTENLITTIYQDLSSLMSQNAEFYCSVNITPLHLQNDDFYHYLKRFQHDYSKLTLELTERQPIENLTFASQRIALLKTLGLKISLDDAGTGYGGNSYLHYFDIDTIKIDKMFTRSIDEGKSAVLDGYIEMAKQLELNLVAEGVENKLEAKGLLLRGVCQHQGYYYAKPMPIEELHRWASDHGYTHEQVNKMLTRPS
ncbi:hypothetical protein VSWAT3_03961 [Vibrionales bacterium SWAT-3]|nr:hypothetical protein VSWAT3_03961 [Vibrionales bacterium SWAT-3]